MRGAARAIQHSRGWSARTRSAIRESPISRPVLRRGEEPFAEQPQLLRIGNALRRHQVIAGIRKFMEKHGLKDAKEIIGSVVLKK